MNVLTREVVRAVEDLERRLERSGRSLELTSRLLEKSRIAIVRSQQHLGARDRRVRV